MRLNLGCGDHYADGWVNVDIEVNDRVRPDVVADLRQLPFRLDRVEAVYLGHVLEHLPFEDARRVLVELQGQLPPGTPVMVVGPDVTLARKLDAETERLARDGRGAWAHDVHLWACEESLLVELLRTAGFNQVSRRQIREVDRFWPLVSHVGWQAAVGAFT